MAEHFKYKFPEQKENYYETSIYLLRNKNLPADNDWDAILWKSKFYMTLAIYVKEREASLTMVLHGTIYFSLAEF